MTMDERVEAAAHGLHAAAPKRDGGINRPWQMLAPDWQTAFRDAARVAVAAAFPELQGDKPTHWLAPWGLTDYEAEHEESK